MPAMNPLTRPGTMVLEDRETTYLPQYKVILHNDDHNSMEHVVRALMRVFKFEHAVCERIMRDAHENGAAVCTIEPLEMAELHRDQLHSFSLISTIEPA